MQFRVYRIALLCLLFLGTISSYSQDLQHKKISLSLTNRPLSEAFSRIEQLTGLTINYSNQLLDDTRHISINVTNESVGTVLTRLLEGTRTYFILKNNLVTILRQPAPVKKKETSFKVEVMVTDINGHPLPGAVIKADDVHALAITDSSGIASFGVQDENASLEVTYIGCISRTFTPGGGGKGIQRLLLRPDPHFLQQVTVRGRRRTDTETGALLDRKNAIQMIDNISARNIEKTASITTAQALQNVSGVTITDDKYVAIRGMGDRNVVVQLNGSRLSSADPDHNSVALDIVPAAFLDNISVYKTITPDKPSDAVAGIVELKTKSIPDSFTVNFTMEYGTNSKTGFGGSITSYNNSDMGFLGQKVKTHDLSSGFTDLAKEFPGGTDEIKGFMQNSRSNPANTQRANQINSLMHSLDPNLTTNSKVAQPDQVYGLTIGNRYKVFGHMLGVVVGLNYYRRTESLGNTENNQWSIYRGQNALPANFTVQVGSSTYTGSFANGDGAPSTGLQIPYYISPNNIVLGKFLAYNENTGKETMNAGGMAAISYRFNTDHTVKFSFIGNRGAEILADNQKGSYANADFEYPILQNTYTLRQTYKTLNIYQATGEHTLHFNKFHPKIEWAASTSDASQDDPDYRYVNMITNYNNMIYLGGTSSGSYGGYQSLVYTTSPTYFLGSQGVISNLFGDPNSKYYVNANGRQFRFMKETNYNATVDLHFPFQAFKKNRQEIKIGGLYLERRRNQQENIMYLPQLPTTLQAISYDSYTSGNQATNVYASVFGNNPGDPNQLISADKIGFTNTNATTEGSYRPVGFLYNVSRSPANYHGSMYVGGLYAMADLHPLPNLRIVGGIRYELTRIKGAADTLGAKDVSLIGTSYSGNFLYVPHPVDYNSQWKPFPSVNITWKYQENTNFRVSYTTTMSRPELREILPIVEFDPLQQGVFVGNTALKDQTVRALDFRWEWFPVAGEVYSASVFGKWVDDQLEKSFSIDSAGARSTAIQFPIIHYVNDPNQAQVYGVELEARKHLGAFIPALKNFFIGANLMLAASVMDKNAERLHANRIVDRNAPATSPLFEQPPYSLNVMLDYDNPDWGTSITLNFNQVGERLLRVDLAGEPDIYSRPIPMLNGVFRQQIGKRIYIKGFVKNILDAATKEVYTNPGDNGKYYGQTYIHRLARPGTQYTIGFSYDMF